MVTIGYLAFLVSAFSGMIFILVGVLYLEQERKRGWAFALLLIIWGMADVLATAYISVN